MMLNIAIIDDNLNVCYQLNEYLNIFFKGSPTHIEDYSNGEEFLESVNLGNHYDVIFLDIKTENCDGIKVASHLRNSVENSNTYIILISAFTDNLIPLFDLQPFAFLQKPIPYQNFENVMIRLLKSIDSVHRIINVKVGRTVKRIDLSKIIYITIEHRKTNIYTTSSPEPVSTNVGIEELQKQLAELSSSFCRIHKSYIINIIHIDSYTKKYVTMDNQTQLPISQRYNSLFNKRLL